MQLIRYPEAFKGPPASVAIGNFDGLHRGHLAVIGAMQASARRQMLVPSVLTFEPHPRRLFKPESPDFRLEPLSVKLRRLDAVGVEQVFMPRFDKHFASMSAETFMDEVLGRQLNAKAVITGENFAFGKGRAGNVEMLASWGAKQGIEIHTVPPVMAEDEPCSSSAVRAAIGRGDVTHATALLGRPYRLAGRVVHGDGRGRDFGFATANIAFPPGLMLPMNGIYAVRVGKRMGAASLGVRPTIGDQVKPSLEVHLLDFEGDLYGQKLEVDFIGWIRPEEKFASLELMVEQIERDCIRARELLS